MKTFLVVLALAVAALAAPSQFEPIWSDYHEEFGIDQAARIKAIEEAIDFDGNRIAGGSEARLGQYPFMGGLIITLTTNQQSVCGSSLLTNTRLVTAAHCWSHGNSQARQFTVVLGSIHLFSGGTRINTNQVDVHAQYNQRNLNNDIAIIRIDHVRLGGNINRINIPFESSTYSGTTANAIGFGLIGDNVGVGTNQALRHVRLTVISNSECQRTFGGTVISSTLCTSGARGRSPCPGDGGGPLQINGPLLIGITSFSSVEGCTRGFPAGFTRVTSFAFWIRARI